MRRKNWRAPNENTPPLPYLAPPVTTYTHSCDFEVRGLLVYPHDVIPSVYPPGCYVTPGAGVPLILLLYPDAVDSCGVLAWVPIDP